MADGGPPTLQSPPAAPAQPVAPPAPHTHLAALPVQCGPVPQLNWSHFKLEFAGKPHEE